MDGRQQVAATVLGLSGAFVAGKVLLLLGVVAEAALVGGLVAAEQLLLRLALWAAVLVRRVHACASAAHIAARPPSLGGPGRAPASPTGSPGACVAMRRCCAFMCRERATRRTLAPGGVRPSC